MCVLALFLVYWLQLHLGFMEIFDGFLSGSQLFWNLFYLEKKGG